MRPNQPLPHPVRSNGPYIPPSSYSNSFSFSPSQPSYPSRHAAASHSARSSSPSEPSMDVDARALMSHLSSSIADAGKDAHSSYSDMVFLAGLQSANPGLPSWTAPHPPPYPPRGEAAWSQPPPRIAVPAPGPSPSQDVPVASSATGQRLPGVPPFPSSLRFVAAVVSAVGAAASAVTTFRLRSAAALSVPSAGGPAARAEGRPPRAAQAQRRLVVLSARGSAPA